MAILQRCCCFSNVRTGSYASAIYTLIYAVFSLAYSAYQIVKTKGLSVLQFDSFVLCCTTLTFLAVILVASVLVLVGLSSNKRGYLLPYMAAMPVVILVQIAECVLYTVYLIEDSLSTGNVAAEFITAIACLLTFTVLDGFCFLCVVSQYQELRDGRGRPQDVTAIQMGSLVTTNPGVGGAMIQSASPLFHRQGYVVTQTGYPAQGCYPAQQTSLLPQHHHQQQQQQQHERQYHHQHHHQHQQIPGPVDPAGYSAGLQQRGYPECYPSAPPALPALPAAVSPQYRGYYPLQQGCAPGPQPDGVYPAPPPHGYQAMQEKTPPPPYSELAKE